jgi:hypothetical protein
LLSDAFPTNFWKVISSFGQSCKRENALRIIRNQKWWDESWIIHSHQGYPLYSVARVKT